MEASASAISQPAETDGGGGQAKLYLPTGQAGKKIIQ